MKGRNQQTHSEHEPTELIGWLGNDRSFRDFIAAEEALTQKMQTMSSDEISAILASQKEDEKQSRLLDVQDGIGIVQVHGTLTNRDNWYNRLFGLTSYNEIRQALTQAAAKSDVKTIVLDVNSGGGAAAGVADIATLIKTIDKEIKEVHTFSDGMMASAAYWLGSSARTVSAGQTAVIGSIGVLMKHIEYSKAMADEGVTATIMRAGKYKALANPYEPLSDLAKSEIDNQLQHTYGVFVAAVSENLGVPYPEVDTKMAQGREFIGRQALDVGLVDEVTSFDVFVEKLREKHLDSNTTSRHPYNQYTMSKETEPMKKKVLAKTTDPDVLLAAAEAGVDLTQDTPETLGSEGDQTVAPEQGAEGTNAAETTAGTETPPVEGSGEVASEQEAGEAPATEPKNEAVALLKSQLKERDEALVSLTVERNRFREQNEALLETHDPFEEIVRQSVCKMRVAMGGSAQDFKALAGKDLLAAHENAVNDFKKAYAIGGVAVSGVVENEPHTETEAPEVDHLYEAKKSSVVRKG